MHQIELAIAQLDIDAQLRVQTHEPRHQRHDEALAVGHCAGHAQHAFRFAGQVADSAQGFFATVLQSLAMLEERLASLGQRHSASTAIKQARLQALFQSYDLSTDVGGRNP